MHAYNYVHLYIIHLKLINGLFFINLNLYLTRDLPRLIPFGAQRQKTVGFLFYMDFIIQVAVLHNRLLLFLIFQLI